MQSYAHLCRTWFCSLYMVGILILEDVMNQPIMSSKKWWGKAGRSLFLEVMGWWNLLPSLIKNWNKTVLFGRVEQQLQQLEASIVELEVDLINERMELEKSLNRRKYLLKQEAREKWLKKREMLRRCFLMLLSTRYTWWSRSNQVFFLMICSLFKWLYP